MTRRCPVCLKLRQERVVQLLDQGFESKNIAKNLSITLDVVHDCLRRTGRKANRYHRSILFNEDGSVTCSKCLEKVEYTDLPLQRRNRHPYRLSYCQNCRSRQIKNVLVSSFDSWLSQKYSTLRSRAKQNSHLFTISEGDLSRIYDKQQGLCFYTDVELGVATGKGWSGNALSLDKVVPEKGYVLGNVVLCTRRANTIKSDISLSEMKEWMPTWYKRLEEKIL